MNIGFDPFATGDLLSRCLNESCLHEAEKPPTFDFSALHFSANAAGVENNG
jgi:hypothetical protein